MQSLVSRNGLNTAAMASTRALQREADARGHGNATLGAGIGGGLGAMIGSFWGPWAALIGGGLLALIGFGIGSATDDDSASC